MSQQEREIATAQILKDLHANWQPHAKQQEVLNAIFYGGKKDVYCECGRKFGKTELAIYFLFRYALLHPKSANYYIAPFLNQAKEIIWATQRVQRFIPESYIKAINNTELRVTLKNDSFIKLDGSDNAKARRGITPHALVADEIAEHDKEFWIAMQPNRAVFNGPLLVIGTPPQQENFATELKEQFSQNKKTGIYYNFPSSSNPHVSKEWLDAEKESLFARGDEAIWYCEYEAKFVRNGKNQIFPGFDPSKHVVAKDKLLRKLKCDFHKMHWFCVADPGSTSCFAVLVGCLNPFTRDLYLLDEIYETDQKYTSSYLIHPRVEEIINQYRDSRTWDFRYDEAAAWFRNEMQHYIPQRNWSPTNKEAMKRDPLTKEPWGLSVIKDALRYDKITIADNCQHLIKEIQNYHRTFNRAGDIKILKRDDHLIDCLRYMIHAAGYSLPEIQEPPPKDPWKLPRRSYTLEEDLKKDAWYY